MTTTQPSRAVQSFKQQQAANRAALRAERDLDMMAANAKRSADTAFAKSLLDIEVASLMCTLELLSYPSVSGALPTRRRCTGSYDRHDDVIAYWSLKSTGNDGRPLVIAENGDVYNISEKYPIGGNAVACAISGWRACGHYGKHLDPYKFSLTFGPGRYLEIARLVATVHFNITRDQHIAELRAGK